MLAAEPLPSLFADLPSIWTEELDGDAPWRLLGEPLDRVLGELPDERIDGLLEPHVALAGTGIVIAKGARIHSGAAITGPVYVGPDAEVRPGAWIRGGAWIGPAAVVGANCEVKRAIFLAGARAPHLNYVGDSILGAGVNLGAGTVLSNFRHDGAEIAVPGLGATGRRKLGAILGDGVRTGCNCTLHPGTVVGAGTSIYPGVQLRAGVYDRDRIIKLRQEIDVIPRQGPP